MILITLNLKKLDMVPHNFGTTSYSVIWYQVYSGTQISTYSGTIRSALFWYPHNMASGTITTQHPFWYQHTLCYSGTAREPNSVLRVVIVCILVLSPYIQDSGTSIPVLDLHLDFREDNNEYQNLGT
jgi:hypothetical protein